MSEEIRVTVCRYGPNRPLALRWTDPITGQRKAKSAGTTNRRQAERLAGELEKSLRAGLAQCPGRITWGEFRERLEREKLPTLAEKTRDSYHAALNHLERAIAPHRLAVLTPGVMSRFQRKLREGGMRETTICTHLRHIKAALSWAVKMRMLPKVPEIEMPKRAKGERLM